MNYTTDKDGNGRQYIAFRALGRDRIKGNQKPPLRETNEIKSDRAMSRGRSGKSWYNMIPMGSAAIRIVIIFK